MSPTVFRYKGYRFYFFSREEDRIHIHVYSSDGEAKFWILPEVSVAKNLWLYAKAKEYFLPYEEFPWFKEAKIADILNVELFHNLHLYWPSLDVDLDLNSLENLSETPLIYQ